ncbi:lysophospholipid acyltransferase family protein [Phaeovulum sp.]|uniref:lysophospholipid acyltransferase family protein n=1 Tax=Phaeovulum sp. TaxID=2934796 RepID=UPI0039E4B667
MKHALQYIRSYLFIGQMYLALALIATLGLPVAFLGGRRGTLAVMHFFCNWVCWSAGWIIGLKTEVRGTPPDDNVLVAAKHQSFLDIIMIFAAVPRGKYIMKKELKWTPFLGWYAWLSGCIPVDRAKRAAAIKPMLRAVRKNKAKGGQLIIFSQGTRVAPGVKQPYKIGTAMLYNELAQDCVPVATNVGAFWPRRSMLRKPGLAVIEFLPRIPAGLPNKEFMARLERDIETASDRLLVEAGFDFTTAGTDD